LWNDGGCSQNSIEHAQHKKRNMSKLILVGGTGGLGTEVAKGLITAEGFEEKVALVRSESEKSKKLADFGWTVVVVDSGNATALQDSMKGAKVVVSTVSGGNLQELECSLMDAAKAAGASLFVPSQFGTDFRRWKGSFPFFDAKLEVIKYGESIGLPTLSVFTGGFSDVFFDYQADIGNKKATVVNSGNTLYSWTRRSDIGYVLAKALANPKYNQGGFLSMCSETILYKEALAVIQDVYGMTFDLEDLSGEEAHQRELDLLAKSDMESFMGAFLTHLLADPGYNGSTGFNVSEEADNHGHMMESFRASIESTKNKTSVAGAKATL
jgi:uncharacterized protein YbjT (DUF2867 family)